MPIPHDQTTTLSAALDAATDQLGAITSNVSDACQKSASHLTLPLVDPDAQIDMATYLGTLVGVGRSMFQSSLAWMATASDNAVLLAARIPVRWVSEVFALDHIDDQQILAVIWNGQSVPVAKAELQRVGTGEARLSVVSLTSHVSELTLLLQRESSTSLHQPTSLLLSMSVDFDVAL